MKANRELSNDKSALLEGSVRTLNKSSQMSKEGFDIYWDDKPQPGPDASTFSELKNLSLKGMAYSSRTGSPKKRSKRILPKKLRKEILLEFKNHLNKVRAGIKDPHNINNLKQNSKELKEIIKMRNGCEKQEEKQFQKECKEKPKEDDIKLKYDRSISLLKDRVKGLDRYKRITEILTNPKTSKEMEKRDQITQNFYKAFSTKSSFGPKQSQKSEPSKLKKTSKFSISNRSGHFSSDLKIEKSKEGFSQKLETPRQHRIILKTGFTPLSEPQGSRIHFSKTLTSMKGLDRLKKTVTEAKTLRNTRLNPSKERLNPSKERLNSTGVRFHKKNPSSIFWLNEYKDQKESLRSLENQAHPQQTEQSEFAEPTPAALSSAKLLSFSSTLDKELLSLKREKKRLDRKALRINKANRLHTNLNIPEFIKSCQDRELYMRVVEKKEPQGNSQLEFHEDSQLL